MNLFTFLKYLFTAQSPFLGALPDTRSDALKQTDIPFGEIVGTAAAVNWQEKAQTTWRTFPVLNQHASSMCGAFSMKKVLGVLYYIKYNQWIDFSEEAIYKARVNKPEPGMSIPDLYAIIQKGVTLKLLTNITIKSDRDADNCVIEQFKTDVGAVFKVGEQINVPIDLETIASIIQTTGKAVHILTYFTTAEWAQFIPALYNSSLQASEAPNRHFVAVVDYTLYKGQKYLIIEDSAWFGGLNRRLISAAWVTNRFVQVTYPMNFVFDKASLPKPLHFFSKALTLNQTSSDITSLQNILKYEGCFPLNVASTGFYGPTTARAVDKFKAIHALPGDSSSVDSVTLFYLNGTYGA